MASTYICKLRHDLEPMLHMSLLVDTSNDVVIKVGDLVQMNTTTQVVRLLEDDEVLSGYAFVGISNSEWDSSLNDSHASERIDVIGVCIVDVTVVSAVYSPGEALQYDNAGLDDGTLKSWLTGQQLIAHVWECSTAATTTLKALMDVRDVSYSFLEASSG